MYECNKLGAVCCIMFTDALMGVCGVRWFGGVPALLAFKGTTASGWVYNFQSGDVSYRGWRRARHPCAHPDGGCLGVQFSPRRGLSWSAVFPAFHGCERKPRQKQACQVFLAEKNVLFFSPKNIPIFKNSSNFASFCVADGFKTNLSY